MKNRTGFKCLIAAFALTVMPGLAMAQAGGFQVAIARPAIAFPAPPQAPGPNIQTHGTFTANPAGLMPSLPPLMPFIPSMPFPQPFLPTVIIPNQVLYPGQTIVPNPALN